MEKLNKRLTRPLSFVDKRICAGIAVALMFASFTFAFHQVDQKYAAGGIAAGVLYLLTTFAFVFEDGIDTGENNDNDKKNNKKS